MIKVCVENTECIELDVGIYFYWHKGKTKNRILEELEVQEGLRGKYRKLFEHEKKLLLENCLKQGLLEVICLDQRKKILKATALAYIYLYGEPDIKKLFNLLGIEHKEFKIPWQRKKE